MYCANVCLYAVKRCAIRINTCLLDVWSFFECNTRYRVVCSMCLTPSVVQFNVDTVALCSSVAAALMLVCLFTCSPGRTSLYVLPYSGALSLKAAWKN